MVRASFVPLLARILITPLLALLAALPAQAQSAQNIQTRNSQAVQLYNQGKYAEALKLAEETLALADGEAEPLYKRALAGREKVLGPEHPDTLKSVGNLGPLYEGQGRYSQAEPLLKRSMGVWRR